MREHPAPVDIGDQQHRAVHRLGKAHVRHITLAQVDLGGASRAFHDDRFILARQALVGFQHIPHRLAFECLVAQRVHLCKCLTMDNHLRTRVGRRLQQDRVHLGMRRQPTSPRLHRLGAADFAAVHRHRAVQYHILRLERRDAHPAPVQQTAQPGH